MPNIFYHNVTPDEITKLDKMTPGRKIDEKSHYEISTDDDLSNADLFRLYTIRGDKEKAKKYLSKIRDNTLKYFLEN
jgi:hypothetical protein